MKRDTITRKTLAGFISAILLATNSALAYQPQVSSLQIINSALSIPSSSPSPVHRTKSSILESKLPSSVLPHITIRSSRAYDSKNIVMIIEDVHQIQEAQTHISGAIKALGSEKGSSPVLVGLEGASGGFLFDVYKRFPSRGIADAVADAYLENGEIGGPAHAGLTFYPEAGQKGIEFVGVDDPVFYPENVAAYREASSRKEQVQGAIKTLTAKLTSQKNRIYSAELKSFDAAARAFSMEELSVSRYIDILSRYDVPTSMVLEMYREAAAMEERLDFKRVDVERRRVIERLVQKLSPADVDSLVQISLQYKEGVATFADYYDYLAILANKAEINLKETPHFDAYIQYVLLSDGIDADALFDDLKQWETVVFNQLARTPEEKILTMQSRQSNLIERLADFALTPDQWSDYRENKGVLADEIDMWAFETFYVAAEKRDQSMIANLLHNNRDDLQVLVAGGFHTAGLIRLLDEKKISHIVAAPKITKIDSESGSSYLSVFDREKSPLDKIFTGEKLFLVKPVVAAATPLLRGEPSPIRAMGRDLQALHAHSTGEVETSIPAQLGWETMNPRVTREGDVTILDADHEGSGVSLKSVVHPADQASESLGDDWAPVDVPSTIEDVTVETFAGSQNVAARSAANRFLLSVLFLGPFLLGIVAEIYQIVPKELLLTYYLGSIPLVLVGIIFSNQWIQIVFGRRANPQLIPEAIGLPQIPNGGKGPVATVIKGQIYIDAPRFAHLSDSAQRSTLAEERRHVRYQKKYNLTGVEERSSWSLYVEELAVNTWFAVAEFFGDRAASPDKFILGWDQRMTVPNRTVDTIIKVQVPSYLQSRYAGDVENQLERAKEQRKIKDYVVSIVGDKVQVHVVTFGIGYELPSDLLEQIHGGRPYSLSQAPTTERGAEPKLYASAINGGPGAFNHVMENLFLHSDRTSARRIEGPTFIVIVERREDVLAGRKDRPVYAFGALPSHDEPLVLIRPGSEYPLVVETHQIGTTDDYMSLVADNPFDYIVTTAYSTNGKIHNRDSKTGRYRPEHYEPIAVVTHDYSNAARQFNNPSLSLRLQSGSLAVGESQEALSYPAFVPRADDTLAPNMPITLEQAANLDSLEQEVGDGYVYFAVYDYQSYDNGRHFGEVKDMFGQRPDETGYLHRQAVRQIDAVPSREDLRERSAATRHRQSQILAEAEIQTGEKGVARRDPRPKRDENAFNEAIWDKVRVWRTLPLYEPDARVQIRSSNAGSGVFNRFLFNLFFHTDRNPDRRVNSNGFMVVVQKIDELEKDDKNSTPLVFGERPADLDEPLVFTDFRDGKPIAVDPRKMGSVDEMMALVTDHSEWVVTAVYQTRGTISWTREAMEPVAVLDRDPSIMNPTLNLRLDENRLSESEVQRALSFPYLAPGGRNGERHVATVVVPKGRFDAEVFSPDDPAPYAIVNARIRTEGRERDLIPENNDENIEEAKRIMAKFDEVQMGFQPLLTAKAAEKQAVETADQLAYRFQPVPKKISNDPFVQKINKMFKRFVSVIKADAGGNPGHTVPPPYFEGIAKINLRLATEAGVIATMPENPELLEAMAEKWVQSVGDDLHLDMVHTHGVESPVTHTLAWITFMRMGWVAKTLGHKWYGLMQDFPDMRGRDFTADAGLYDPSDEVFREFLINSDVAADHVGGELTSLTKINALLALANHIGDEYDRIHVRNVLGAFSFVLQTMDMKNSDGSDMFNDSERKRLWDNFIKGRKPSSDSPFSGNIQGQGPGYAELGIEDDRDVKIAKLAMDKAGPAAFNIPIYWAIRQAIRDHKIRSAVFEIWDVEHHTRIFLDYENDKEKILKLLSAPNKYNIKRVWEKNDETWNAGNPLKSVGGVLIAASTEKLAVISGGEYLGKDDPVLFALEEIGHYVFEFTRTKHYLTQGDERGSNYMDPAPLPKSNAVATIRSRGMMTGRWITVKEDGTTDVEDEFAKPEYDEKRETSQWFNRTIWTWQGQWTPIGVGEADVEASYPLQKTVNRILEGKDGRYRPLKDIAALAAAILVVAFIQFGLDQFGPADEIHRQFAYGAAPFIGAAVMGILQQFLVRPLTQAIHTRRLVRRSRRFLSSLKSSTSGATLVVALLGAVPTESVLAEKLDQVRNETVVEAQAEAAVYLQAYLDARRSQGERTIEEVYQEVPQVNHSNGTIYRNSIGQEPGQFETEMSALRSAYAKAVTDRNKSEFVVTLHSDLSDHQKQAVLELTSEIRSEFELAVVEAVDHVGGPNQKINARELYKSAIQSNSNLTLVNQLLSINNRQTYSVQLIDFTLDPSEFVFDPILRQVLYLITDAGFGAVMYGPGYLDAVIKAAEMARDDA